MGRITVTVCLLGFFAVAASAYTLSKSLSTSDEETEAQAELSAEEAFQVGLILLEVAHDLEHDDELKSETDEYFFRSLWNKTKVAAKKYGGKLKQQFKKYFNRTKIAVKEAAKELAMELAKEAQRRLAEKATKVLNEIFSNSAASYSLEDIETNADVVKYMCAQIKDAGLALIERSKELRNREASL